MTNEKTLEILKEMKADPNAKELFEGMEKPKSPDEAIAAYAQVAEKLGYAITTEDIREAVKQEEARHKANTDKVVADMEALEDDDLEGVAGGFYTFVNGEKVYDKCLYNFNNTTTCGSRDACEIQDIYYYDCPGKVHANGAEEYCWFDLN